MTYIHLHIVPSTKRPYWRTDERFPQTTGEKVWTDCCCCKQPAEETISRISEPYQPPLGGFGGEANGFGKFIDRSPDEWSGIYYDSVIETVCADGFGCTVNPRKKAGFGLRSYWRWG